MRKIIFRKSMEDDLVINKIIEFNLDINYVMMIK